MRISSFVWNSLMAMSIATSLLSSATARAGSIYFDVIIDTSSFSGKSGDVEFQLGGGATNVPVTATFSRFSSDAALNGPIQNLSVISPPDVTVTGDLSTSTGDLNAGSLSLYSVSSANQVSDADQLVSSFGTYFDFRVTLSDGTGAAYAGTANLAISMFDGSTPFFNGPDDRNNAAVFIQTIDGVPTFTQYQLNSVPEPSSLISMLVGAVGIGVGMYRRGKLAARFNSLISRV